MFKNVWQKRIVCILLLVIFVAIFVKMFPCEYSRTAYVDEIKGNDIILIDRHGNLWIWEKEKNEEFCLNEKVTLVFDNNGTDDFVEDDIILRIEK